ncbi:lactose-binding lectin l-2-like [Ruditapes philippinarum]|uniref:lactose-binding lectin l-2-like n=1 Tax=Ruditapes philippinarum TaxID=129788 RepID=UPI00295B7DC1|nr:lactose-binding lectin l-2-like [Ruditapes philippinarum]
MRDIWWRSVEHKSKEENDFIVNHFKKIMQRPFWIGIHDTQEENNWQWGSSNLNKRPGDFFNWAPNEPSNAYNNEDCGTIHVNGQWNDRTCSDLLPFICEADPQID